MNINLLVLNIVKQINELRMIDEESKDEKEATTTLEEKPTTGDNKLDENEQNEKTASKSIGDDKKSQNQKPEKNASALIYVILEICIKDLIKYLPNLLQSKSALNQTTTSQQHQQQTVENQTTDALSTAQMNKNISKSSFLYLHVAKCKQLSGKDVELIKKLLIILNELSFHSHVNFESI